MPFSWSPQSLSQVLLLLIGIFLGLVAFYCLSIVLCHMYLYLEFQHFQLPFKTKSSIISISTVTSAACITAELPQLPDDSKKH